MEPHENVERAFRCLRLAVKLPNVPKMLVGAQGDEPRRPDS
jgi:hypothetical protein